MGNVHQLDSAWRRNILAAEEAGLSQCEDVLIGIQLREDGAVPLVLDAFAAAVDEPVQFNEPNAAIQRAILDAHELDTPVNPASIGKALRLDADATKALRQLALGAPVSLNRDEVRNNIRRTIREWQHLRRRSRATLTAGQIAENLSAGHATPTDLVAMLKRDTDAMSIVYRPREPLSLTLSDFLAVRLPERDTLMAPWLVSGGLAMVHAWRGVGKTHFCAGVAMAAATGSKFLRWTAPKPSSVLYVDGEMPGQDMQQRLRDAVAMYPMLEDPTRFRLITPDKLPRDSAVPNLLTPEGQAAIEKDLEGRDLVILDNVATLFRSGDDPNSTTSWLPAQDYILTLRRRAIAVLLVDHDNKTGGNRGTSGKHDVLDTVIQLKQPNDYIASQGARFEVHFMKHRSFWGRDAAPFEAQLIEGPEGPTWAMKDADDAQLERYAELAASGLKDRDIREELGIGGSRLATLKKLHKDRVSK